MLKSGKLSTINNLDYENGSDQSNKRDLTTEFIIAPLYKRLLYNRAPTIGLVQEVKPTADNLYLKSKFLENFSTLKDVKGIKYRQMGSVSKDNPLKEGEIAVGLEEGNIVFQTVSNQTKEIINCSLSDKAKLYGVMKTNPTDWEDHVSNLLIRSSNFKQYIKNYQEEISRKLKGFEKVIAVSLFLGEIDYHGENLGVIKNDGELQVVKIDHGRSAGEFYTSEISLFASLQHKLESFGYSNIPLNANKFKEAIDELCKVQESEIENLIKNQIYKLKETKFKLNRGYQTETLGHKIIYGETPSVLTGIQISFTISPSQGICCQVDGKAALIITKNDIGDPYFSRMKTIISTKEVIGNDELETQEKFLEFLSSQNSKSTSLPYLKKTEQALRYEDLENYLINSLKKHQVMFKEIKETLAVVELIEYDANPVINQHWQDKGWMNAIYSVHYRVMKNPIEWAIENGKKIAGKDALEWAKENNKTTGIDIKNSPEHQERTKATVQAAKNLKDSLDALDGNKKIRSDLKEKIKNYEGNEEKSNKLALVAKVLSGGLRKTDADLVNEIRGYIKEYNKNPISNSHHLDAISTVSRYNHAKPKKASRR